MAIPNGIHPQGSPTGVHFVGSICLQSAEEVFTTLASVLPRHLQRIPDGETGKRAMFTLFQQEFFAAAPQVIRQYDANFNTVTKPLPSQSDVDAAIATLKESESLSTHYDTHAIESYRLFKSLQSAGTIPKGTKFQVSLPTPANVICLTNEGYQAALEPLYEEALLKSLRNIEAAIPHEDLSIQWDIASEFAYLEGATWPHFNPWFSPAREWVIERSLRLINAAGASRAFTYVHLPVPKNRTDEAYFVPLKDLDARVGHLYLGLVHANDLEGTKERISTAAKVLQGRAFGVASECGFGRSSAEELKSIIEIAGVVSGPWEDGVNGSYLGSGV